MLGCWCFVTDDAGNVRSALTSYRIPTYACHVFSESTAPHISTRTINCQLFNCTVWRTFFKKAHIQLLIYCIYASAKLNVVCLRTHLIFLFRNTWRGVGWFAQERRCSRGLMWLFLNESEVQSSCSTDWMGWTKLHRLAKQFPITLRKSISSDRDSADLVPPQQ